VHSVTDRRKKAAFRQSWIHYHNNCISKDFGAQTKIHETEEHALFTREVQSKRSMFGKEGQNRQKVERIRCQDWSAENGNYFSEVLVGVSKNLNSFTDAFCGMVVVNKQMVK